MKKNLLFLKWLMGCFVCLCMGFESKAQLQLTDDFTINRIAIDKSIIIYQTNKLFSIDDVKKYKIYDRNTLNYVYFGSDIIKKLIESTDNQNNPDLFNFLIKTLDLYISSIYLIYYKILRKLKK